MSANLQWNNCEIDEVNLICAIGCLRMSASLHWTNGGISGVNLICAIVKSVEVCRLLLIYQLGVSEEHPVGWE